MFGLVLDSLEEDQCIVFRHAKSTRPLATFVCLFWCSPACLTSWFLASISVLERKSGDQQSRHLYELRARDRFLTSGSWEPAWHQKWHKASIRKPNSILELYCQIPYRRGLGIFFGHLSATRQKSFPCLGLWRALGVLLVLEV